MLYRLTNITTLGDTSTTTATSSVGIATPPVAYWKLDESGGDAYDATGNGYTACHTFEVDEFSYKKLSDTQLLTTYQSTTVTTDTSKADCVANFGSAGNGSVQKFMFLLTK